MIFCCSALGGSPADAVGLGAVGLTLPLKATVLRVDEKSPIQALESTQVGATIQPAFRRAPND
jgi:hypothetical protein